MIVLYNVLMLIAIGWLLPIIGLFVTTRKKYRHTFQGRLFMKKIDDDNGKQKDTDGGRIWIHALSVGEVLSAQPLVTALADTLGAGNLVFTTSTKTGFETAIRVISPHVHAVRFFPYDILFSVHRALQVIRPARVIIVETDIWPNFLFRLKQCSVPVHLVNARLSERSYLGYKRVGFLIGPLLNGFTNICAQTEKDRHRFENLGVGANRIITVGNIKFDQEPACVSFDDRNRMANQLCLSPEVPVWVAGSTHEKEEVLLVDAYGSILQNGIETVLIIAPRDPDRALDVCGIFNNSHGINARTLTQMEKEPGLCNVIVIDRIGILRRLYDLAEIAFVGGSLVNAGGHNPLEPTSVSIPVLFGPHTEDFQWICEALVNEGGAVRIKDANQLSEQIMHLLRNKDKKHLMGQRAYEVFSANRGAVERTLKVIESH